MTITVGLLVLLTIAAATWAFTTRRRRLASAEQVLSSLTPGQLNLIERFAASDADYLLANDEKFWRETGKLEGLRARRRNAVWMVQFGQILCREHALPKEDLQFVIVRASLISVLSALALLESFTRIFAKGLPHLCARVASILYYEMGVRLMTICEQYAPELVLGLSESL